MFYATACNERESKEEKDPEVEELIQEDSLDQNTEREQLSNDHFVDTEAAFNSFNQVTAGAKAQMKELTSHYLEIKNALVASNAAAAKEAASKLSAPLDSFNATSLPAKQQNLYMEQAGAIREAANGITKAQDIETQRKHLGTLSQALYVLNKSFGTGENQLYHQYCPMANNNKGGYWLSAEKEVRNPYFGDKMLKCGKVAETL